MVFNIEDTTARLRGTQRRLMSGALDFETGAAPKKASPRLKFPLHNENEYPAYILFQPVITTPPNLGGGASGAIGEMIKFISDTTYTAATGNAVPADPAQPAEGPGTLANAGERDIPPAEFKAQSILTNENKTNSRSSCKMYMPSSIVFQDGVSYSTADLGLAGGAAAAGMAKGEGMIESLASGGFQSLGNLYDALKGSVSQDAARLGATRLAGMAGKNGVIDGAVRGTLRTSPVANMTMLFDKPQLRTFSFSFKMQPVSEIEAEMVSEIVKFFRTELYPDAFNTDTLGGISVPFGYRFPNEIKISLHYGKGDNSGKNFIRFKPCYLTNFQATFNAPSASFFKGGHFQETTISMTLRENELLNKKDIQDGF
jgi:hypothetical protein